MRVPCKAKHQDEVELSTLKAIYPIAPHEVYVDENPLRHPNHAPGRHDKGNELETSAMEKFYNRLILCLFAVCLLWLTSLQVCAAVVGLNIKVPSFTLVASNFNYAYLKVTEQRDYYAACARRQIDRCTEELDDEYVQQKMNLLASQQLNLAFAHSFDSIVTNCSNAVAMSKKAINAWSSAGRQYTIPYYPTCAGTERQSVVASLGDTTSSRTSVYAASLAYTQSSDSTIERLAEYSFALNTYNAAYLHNKTRQLQDLAQSVVLDVSTPHIQAINVSFAPVGRIVDQLLVCASLSPNSSTCTYPVSLTQVYNIQKGISEIMLVKMRRYMDDVVAFFDMMAADIDTAIGAANAFYDSVRGPKGIIAWVLANSGLTGLCGKSTPNFCSFTKESWMVYMGYLPPIPTLGAILAPALLWEKVKGVEVGERLKLSALTTGLQKEVAGWVRDVKQAIQSADFTPKDYDPPQYPAAINISQEPAVQAQRSSDIDFIDTIMQRFIDSVESILSSANSTTQEDVAGTAKSINATDYLDLASSSLSGYTFTWADFSTASVDIALLVESFLAVNSVLFLFDYLYRAFQTVRLVNRFWRRGGVKLPRADLRSHKPEIVAGWFICIDRCLVMIPFFSVQLALLGTLVVLLMWSFVALFVPEYQSYVSSCVHHSSNHTFVSRNLNSLAFNYASSDGNSVISHGLSRYNAQAAKYCSGSAASSLQAYTAVVNQMYASNQTLTTVREDAGKLSACIDLPSLDASFYQACCDTDVYALSPRGSVYERYAWPSADCTASSLQCPTVDGEAEYAFLPPGAYLANGACSDDYLLSESGAHILVNAAGTTREAAFDCKALPTCQVTCTGPDAALVSGLSKHCACLAEWYFNGVFLQSLLSLLAYLLTNLSRILVTKGIVQVLWRELAPEIFEYTADCDLHGSVLGNSALARHQQGAGDVEKCADGEFSAALSAVIKQRTAAFVLQGYFWIALGVLVNAPWVVLIFVLRSNIEYEG